MKSLDVNQDPATPKPDLVARSYSPFLRVLVVGAIFIVAVFVLAACGSKANTPNTASNTPTQSSAVTPTQSSAVTPTQSSAVTPSASATVASAQTCQADTSSDSISVGTYFGKVLAQARKEWKSDAVISSVRIEDRNGTNFNSLCTLRTDAYWNVFLYSLSTKNELVAALDPFNKKVTEMPAVRYGVFKKLADNSQTYTSLTMSEMKKQGGWSFQLYSRPELAVSEAKGPANLFLSWKMSMSQVIQKFLDRTKTEKITGTGYNIYIGKASLKTKSPFAYIYWQNGAKRTAFYVEPVTLTSYDYKY